MVGEDVGAEEHDAVDPGRPLGPAGDQAQVELPFAVNLRPARPRSVT